MNNAAVVAVAVVCVACGRQRATVAAVAADTREAVADSLLVVNQKHSQRNYLLSVVN